MVGFLNKNGEKVFTKESTDNLLKRINEYGFDYVKSVLPYIKAQKKIDAIIKFIGQNLINRKDLIFFLQKRGKKVYTNESMKDLIKRINDKFTLTYIKSNLRHLKTP